jgi:hypothetical protein
MVALTNTWFDGAYDQDYVFDPKHKMTKNDDEIQGRWTRLGKKMGICPGSFVWHYRSVTRKPSGKGEVGAFRISTKGK